MKFILDEDVYFITGNFLMEKGHSVIFPKDCSLAGSPDDVLLEKACVMKRILITRDKDFGSLVFLEKRPTSGVILLRIQPATIQAIHNNLAELVSKYSEEELSGSFCTVDTTGFRIRDLPTS